MATNESTTRTVVPPPSVSSMLDDNPSASRHAEAMASQLSATRVTSDTDATGTATGQDGVSDGAAPTTQSGSLATASAATALTTPTSSIGSGDGGNGSSDGASASDSRPQAASEGGSGGMSNGTKIGIGVGVGVGVAVVIALIAVFLIMRRRRKSKYPSDKAGVEQMRGQPAMDSTAPALVGASSLGRAPSYRSTTRSSYHSLSPTGPPPLPETASDPVPETTKAAVPVHPTIIPPSQQSLPREPAEHQTPGSRRSMEAEMIHSPAAESLATPAPPYIEAPSPIDEHPSRSISPVSAVSSMGSRPPSLRHSFDS